MKLKFRPLGDRILVKRLDEEKEQKTTGGIIIPDTAKEKPMEAKVEAIGPGRHLEDGKLLKMDVKVGDRVLIGKYSGTDVKIEGDEYVIMREDDVLGVIEP
jgi:chaperonin GroES